MPSVRSMLGLVAVLTTGCANLIGLNDLEEVQCVGAGCLDASIDTAGAEVAADSATPESGAMDSLSADSELDSGAMDADPDAADSATADSAMVDAPDATDALDATVDSMVADTKVDALVDSKVETGLIDTGVVDTGLIDTGGGDTCTVGCDTVRSNGATCFGSICAYSSCKTGFANCNTTAPDTDGCETPTTNTLNCGGCGVKCEPVNASTASCTSGACAYTCTSGFGDCDKTGGNTNGCETPLNTLTNCGACGAACDTVRSTGAACSAMKCTYSGCASGFANCDTSGSDFNGCETALDADVANCGACTRACATTNVGTRTCSGGVCTSSCAMGFSNCNKPVAPSLDDGCECAGPVCCGTGCAPAHQNCVGAHCATASPTLGQDYWIAAEPCRAKGTPGDASTYTEAMAAAARAAWPGSTGATLTRGICGGGATANVLAADTGSSCITWGYAGTIAGYVRFNNAMGGACLCPSASYGTWN